MNNQTAHLQAPPHDPVTDRESWSQVPDQMLPAPAHFSGRRRLARIAGCLVLLAALIGPSGAAQTRWAEVVVQGEGAAAAVAAAGGRLLAGLPLVGGVLGRVPAGRAGTLGRSPGVRAAVDAASPLQVRGAVVDDATAHPAGAAAVASATSAGGAAAEGDGTGVAVGVLDTGIAAHGDLAGRVAAHVDLSGERTFTDAYGHGTFMAGLIAGDGRGGGPAGLAPGASLVDLRVAGADGATTLGRVLCALQLADWASDRLNLRVLNLSLGAPPDDPATAPLTEAVERLWAGGVTVVTAAGNEGGQVDAPGIDPYAVTVGALDPAGRTVPAWSGRGPDFAGRPKPDLVAPGVGVVGLRAPGSTVDTEHPEARVGEAYLRGSGTSMAAATVSGAAALLAAGHPDWGPDQVKAALTGTAEPLPGQGGTGALDVGAALRLGAVEPANGDLYPLRRPGPVRPPAGQAGWLATGGGLRWDPATAVGPEAGAWLARNWAASAWTARHWAAEQWLARSWAARHWAASAFGDGPAPAWASLQWAWGEPGAGQPGGVWLARSWAARHWAARHWAGPPP
jgi:serine protease AprX